MTEGYTTTTSVPLYYRIDGESKSNGSDRPIILLHGGPGAHHDYLYPQMLFLAERRAVLTYDQRGGGKSRTDDPAPITWRTQVDDLARVMDEFDIESPTIVGYSWGALLAMLYTTEAASGAGRTPARLVLISPAPITRAWRMEFEANLSARSRSDEVAAMRTELNESGLREQDAAAYRQRSFELSVAGYFADPRKAKSLTPFRVTGKVQTSVWDSLGDFDLRNSLSEVCEKLQIPSLVVHGRHDPIPLASAEAAAQRLGATFVVLEDCGHVPYVEQPAALSAAVEKFLETTAH